MSSDSTAKEQPPANAETSPPSFPLSSLPDAVALSCLARVTRSDYTALSLVSKRYRSLVISSDFYKTRLLLGRTEECLYVCLSSKHKPTPRWFVLRRERNKTLEEADKTVNRLIPIPSHPSQPGKFSSFVALDWGIYVIGGLINNGRTRTSKVMLLDCRTNSWHRVPSMGVARASAAAGVVDGKIYVFGGCEDTDSSNWAEVFDPKTQTWDTLVPMPDRKEGDNLIRETTVMDDKVYAVSLSNGSFYYSPREGKWGREEEKKKAKAEMASHCSCVSVSVTDEKLLYGTDGFGNVFWREADETEWKEVKGLKITGVRGMFAKMKSFLKQRSEVCGCRAKKLKGKVSNFGGNIVVFLLGDSEELCAEISLERREEEGEIWGTTEWSQVVTTLADNAPFPGSAPKLLYSASLHV